VAADNPHLALRGIAVRLSGRRWRALTEIYHSFVEDVEMPAVAGLGIGVSTICASGEVYKLNNIAQFPGAYAQGRHGLALGNKSAGDLWRQNDAGGIRTRSRRD
jgi:hypothetical protein